MAGIGLAATGIFGVLAFYVTSRSREIGVRLALGARRGDRLMLVLRRALLLSLGGAILGTAGAVALTRLLTEYLVDVRPLDPATFAGVIVTIAGLTVIAAYVPARRASTLDPLAVLRSE